MEENNNPEQALDQFTQETSHSQVQSSDTERYEEKSSATKDLGMVLDVPLNISVELGRTDISLKDLLQFKSGTVLELDKLAGEPLEVLVNKRDVAKGEVVVINEKYGIRLTDIVGGKLEE